MNQPLAVQNGQPQAVGGKRRVVNGGAQNLKILTVRQIRCQNIVERMLMPGWLLNLIQQNLYTNHYIRYLSKNDAYTIKLVNRVF